ncbi:MAG: hypothetical protein ACYSTI_14225, partial [Planctomycetota bacterium]
MPRKKFIPGYDLIPEEEFLGVSESSLPEIPGYDIFPAQEVKEPVTPPPAPTPKPHKPTRLERLGRKLKKFGYDLVEEAPTTGIPEGGTPLDLPVVEDVPEIQPAVPTREDELQEILQAREMVAGIGAKTYTGPSIYEETQAYPEVSTTRKLGQVVGSFAKGLGMTVSALPESVAIAGKALDDALPEKIQSYPDQETKDLATYRAGQAVHDMLEDLFPDDPELQNSFLFSHLPRGFGSLFSFMGTGLLGRATGGTAWAVTALTGAAVESSFAYREAKEAGASEEEARWVAALNIPGGASEAIPVGRAFARMDKASRGGLKRLVMNMAAGGLEELTQETFFQTVPGNIVAQQIYDNEREWLEGTPVAAGVGGITGATMSGILTAVGARPRGKVKPPPVKLRLTPDEVVRDVEERARDLPDRGGAVRTGPRAGVPLEPTERVAPATKTVAPATEEIDWGERDRREQEEIGRRFVEESKEVVSQFEQGTELVVPGNEDLPEGVRIQKTDRGFIFWGINEEGEQVNIIGDITNGIANGGSRWILNGLNDGSLRFREPPSSAKLP